MCKDFSFRSEIWGFNEVVLVQATNSTQQEQHLCIGGVLNKTIWILHDLAQSLVVTLQVFKTHFKTIGTAPKIVDLSSHAVMQYMNDNVSTNKWDCVSIISICNLLVSEELVQEGCQGSGYHLGRTELVRREYRTTRLEGRRL